MSAPSDEDVSNFMAFTGSSDTQSATSYLEMANGNLEAAVSLYMDHQAGGGPSGLSGPTAAASGGGGGGGISAGGDPDWMSNDAGAGLGPDGVRAPDMSQRMRMVDDDHMMHPMSRMLGPGGGLGGNHFMGEDPNEAGQSMWGAADGDGGMNDSDDEENEDVAAAIAFGRSSGIGNDATSADLFAGLASSNAAAPAVGAGLSARDMANVAAFGAGAQSAVAEDEKVAAGPSGPRLEDMFASPSYRHRAGGFQGARNVAKDARRWLLVNLQSRDDFACHALNRDVWGDELVQNLVQEGFILWQELNTTQDGQTYAQRYKVHGYPHVAIIDPRTGRLMWRKEGWTQQNPMESEAFAEVAADFCSRHSFDKPPAAPRPSNSSSAPAAKPAKRPIQEMTEDEQLQAALRASMTDDGMEDNDDDNNSGDLAFEDNDENSEANDANSPAKKQELEKELTMADTLQDVQVGDEVPANGEGAVRIAFRMHDGKRLVRRFRKTDPIRLLFAFVLQHLPEAQAGRSFQLRAGYPPKDLKTAMESGTVESEGLAGGQVTVSLLSED